MADIEDVLARLVEVQATMQDGFQKAETRDKELHDQNDATRDHIDSRVTELRDYIHKFERRTNDQIQGYQRSVNAELSAATSRVAVLEHVVEERTAKGQGSKAGAVAGGAMGGIGAGAVLLETLRHFFGKGPS